MQTILNYKIERVLGEGGMGKVYLGIEETSGQKVAIKELYAHLAANASLRKRFEKEARVLAALDHPGIVKLYRYAESADGFYLIMEYVEGIPLDEYILNVTGPVSQPKMVEIMSALLDAFQYAHEKGIIHRDIKPANILFTKEHKVKVLDFGIAKMTQEPDQQTKLTKTGTRMGTVMYMSPEQVRGREVDQRTDVYSLGVLLYYMATGKPPYDDTTLSEFEINVKIVQEPLPPARSVYPFVSAALQKVISKATAKDLNLRYASCAEFKADLLREAGQGMEGGKTGDGSTGKTEVYPLSGKKSKVRIGLVVAAVIFLLGFGLYRLMTKNSGGQPEKTSGSYASLAGNTGASTPADSPATDQGSGADHPSSGQSQSGPDQPGDSSSSNSGMSGSGSAGNWDSGTEAEKIQVLQAVIRLADEAEIEAERTLDPSGLGSRYTGEALEVEENYIQRLKDAGTYKMATLDDIQYHDFQFFENGQSAQVAVTETWSSVTYSVASQSCINKYARHETPQTYYMKNMVGIWKVYKIVFTGSSSPQVVPCD